MDIVYIVRPGDHNEELRHSLRSLENLPHGQVWLAGGQPSWTTNVGRIPVRHTASKWRNQEANLRAACEHPDVSDPFVMFNDDFFVVAPIDQIPVWHRGPFRNLMRKYQSRHGEYPRRIKITAQKLGMDALAYDALHTPMTIVKRQMLETLKSTSHGVLFRSAYGNQWQIGGTMHKDVKIARTNSVGGSPLVSTSDRSFRELPVGKRIRRLFPDPGRYEQ